MRESGAGKSEGEREEKGRRGRIRKWTARRKE
jgi:hypothetical protein